MFGDDRVDEFEQFSGPQAEIQGVAVLIQTQHLLV